MANKGTNADESAPGLGNYPVHVAKAKWCNPKEQDRRAPPLDPIWREWFAKQMATMKENYERQLEEKQRQIEALMMNPFMASSSTLGVTNPQEFKIVEFNGPKVSRSIDIHAPTLTTSTYSPNVPSHHPCPSFENSISSSCKPMPQNKPRKRIEKKEKWAFDDLLASRTSTFKFLVEIGILEPLKGWKPKTHPLPNKWDHSKYCSYHQFSGHDTEGCYCLKKKIQDLIDNKVLPKVMDDLPQEGKARLENAQGTSQEEIVYRGAVKHPRG